VSRAPFVAFRHIFLVVFDHDHVDVGEAAMDVDW